MRSNNYWSWSTRGSEQERKEAVERWMLETEFMKWW